MRLRHLLAALAFATAPLTSPPALSDEQETAAMLPLTLTLKSKTLLDATSPLMHASYLHATGTQMVKVGGYSPDNGQSWTSLPPSPDFDGGLPHGYRREGFPLFADHLTGSILRVVPAMDTPGLDPNTVEPPVALETYYLRYRVSKDGGKTYLFDEQIVAAGQTEENPFEGVWRGKNAIFMGDVGSQMLRTQQGKILIPAQACILGEDGKLASPGGGFTYTDVVIVIGTWQDDGRLSWETARRIQGDPARSTRGMIEPTLAQFADGRILCVMRGSNGGSKDPDCLLPSYKWFSVSADGGYTWTTPQQWTYDDGSSFHSPSAMSQLLTHSSGRCLWIGNLSPQNCRGNHPRHPLVIGEVDPKTLLLRRGSVIEVDGLQPGEGDVNLSHWWGLEDRPTGDIVIVGARHNIGYTSSQPVKYVVGVR